MIFYLVLKIHPEDKKKQVTAYEVTKKSVATVSRHNSIDEIDYDELRGLESDTLRLF